MIVMFKLIAALSMVESRGNPRAYNPEEHAVGHLQIRQCVIDDVNRIYGHQFTLLDAYNKDHANWICVLYLNHWTRVTGQDTMESAARIWNGGPDGWYQLSTLPYWKKVKAELDRHVTIREWQPPQISPSPAAPSAFTLGTTAASSSRSDLAITYTFVLSEKEATASPSISFRFTIKPSASPRAPQPASPPPTSRPVRIQLAADSSVNFHFRVLP